LRENYQISPPDWVDAMGYVYLHIKTASLSTKILPIGEIGFNNRNTIFTRKTPITFYGTNNFPQKLWIEFRILMEETIMGYSVGKDVMLPNP